jgi:hypothetical protein
MKQHIADEAQVRVTKQHQRAVRSDRVGQDGAVLVEFALVLPILLILLLGIVEFGRVFNYWIDETHLANVAARWAAVDKNPGDSEGESLQQWILSQADTAELSEGDADSDPARVCIEFLGSEEVGEPVEATVSFDHNWMPFISNEALGGLLTTTLTGSATMRLEQAPSEYTSGGTDCGEEP